jgi:hypothetical protein
MPAECNLLESVSNAPCARVAELVDALDLGSSGEIRRGSSPLSRTTAPTKHLRNPNAPNTYATCLLMPYPIKTLAIPI